jgi:hypothetical protein
MVSRRTVVQVDFGHRRPDDVVHVRLDLLLRVGQTVVRGFDRIVVGDDLVLDGDADGQEHLRGQSCGGEAQSASAAAAAHSHAISLSATRTLSLDFVSQAISICWRRIETVVAMLSTNGIKQFKPGRAIVLNAPQVSMIFTLLV